MSTEAANLAEAQRIVLLCKDDKYFNNTDAMLDVNTIQTVGYMATCRNKFDLLDSTQSVTCHALINTSTGSMDSGHMKMFASSHLQVVFFGSVVQCPHTSTL